MNVDPTYMTTVVIAAFSAGTVAGAILARIDLWRHR